MAHVPVLLDEVLEGLSIRGDGCYVDATFGRGGHSSAIMQRLGDAGRLLAIDRDAAAVAAARRQWGDDARFTIVHAPFSAIDTVAAQHGVLGRVDGVLFDFGVSSPQLDDAERGFSFSHDGPLDMRMDQRQRATAADYLAGVSESELRRDLATLGEERLAGRFARAIIAARAKAPITRTRALAEIIEAATPARVLAGLRRHPATKVFQALRMRVNAEISEIEQALDKVLDVLAIGGRVCFITFHSLEDRPVKRFLRKLSAEDPVYRGLPDMPEWARPRLATIGRAQTASDAEIARNPRARSARLRVAERLR